MFTVELYARIRRAVMVEGLSRREAAKWFGVHRNTVTKMLSFSVPPGYRRRERPASRKLGPFMAWIDAILESDRSVHKKQLHTAHRIPRTNTAQNVALQHKPRPASFFFHPANATVARD